MTHRKITVKAEQQPDTQGADFAALADQLIQESWHLPPEGDQSWREQDARRIFSGQSEDEAILEEDPPANVTAEAEDAALEPGFAAPKALHILLPVSLATFVMVLAVSFSMPEILTAGFWSEPKPAPHAAITPVSMADAAPFVARREAGGPSKLRPSLAEGVRPLARPVGMADKAKAMVLPDRGAAHKQVAKDAAPKAAAYRATVNAEAQSQQTPRRKLSRLPPIGEAYFASRARTTRKASTDWKAEVAKWDETAAQIRARRAGAASEFPD